MVYLALINLSLSFLVVVVIYYTSAGSLSGLFVSCIYLIGYILIYLDYKKK